MAKTNPASFAFRMAQMQSLEVGLYMANMENNPEAWKEISDREKASNFIITTGMKREDEQGRIRHHYIKIPKDQGQRVFASVARAPFERMLEGKYPKKEIFMALKDFTPAIENLPPTAAAIFGYKANRNFYFEDDIWKGKDVLPADEFTASTPEVYKAAGKLGLSPERTRYAVSQFLTYRNPWKDLMGEGYKLLTDQMDEKSERSLSEKLSKSMFIRRFSGETYPGAGEKDKVQLLAREEESRRKRIKDELYPALREGDKIKTNWILLHADPEDRGWIKNTIKQFRITKGADFKWIELSSELPVVRAKYFFDEWVQASPEGREELFKEVRRVPRFYTDSFRRMFNKFKKEYESGEETEN